MIQNNIAIVRRWFEEVWNERRSQIIEELIEDDSVCYLDEGEMMRGPKEFRERQYEPMMAAFPDLFVKIEGIIGQDDHVVVRWSGMGTHTGNGLGCSPTGEQVEMRGFSWFQVEDGKIKVGWQSSNISSVLEKLIAKSSAR